MQPAISFEEPAAAGRQAQLILTLLIAALLPAIVLAYPVQTHAVKIDLPRLPDAVVPMPPGSAPPAYALTTVIVPYVDLEPRPIHELVLTPQDKLLWNGKAVDVAGVRDRLLVVGDRGEWVDFRPDPHARYEAFTEILALTKRAYLERLRLDNRPFRTSIQEPDEPLRAKARR